MSYLKALAGLHTVVHRNQGMMAEMFTMRQRKALAKFMQAPEDGTRLSLIQTRAGAPASGEIFGMLKGMKEGFETTMSNAQKEEATSQSDFENLKATKTEEIKAGTAQVETKTQELASADEKNALSKQDIEDTSASLAADTEFLVEVKAKCEGMDAE